jgi:hypothetical protein
MKRHIIVGLLTIFVLAPVVEVFSASRDLAPEEREELGVQQPSFVMEFPFAPNGVVGLTFLLWVTNGTTAPIPIAITTVPNGQTPITRPFTLGPSQIASFGPGDVTCAAGQICRLVVVHTAGPAAAFDAILQLSDTAGNPAGFITPTFVYTTQ